jgi:hypothetical protein
MHFIVWSDKQHFLVHAFIWSWLRFKIRTDQSSHQSACWDCQLLSAPRPLVETVWNYWTFMTNEPKRAPCLLALCHISISWLCIQRICRNYERLSATEHSGNTLAAWLKEESFGASRDGWWTDGRFDVNEKKHNERHTCRSNSMRKILVARMENSSTFRHSTYRSSWTGFEIVLCANKWALASSHDDAHYTERCHCQFLFNDDLQKAKLMSYLRQRFVREAWIQCRNSKEYGIQSVTVRKLFGYTNRVRNNNESSQKPTHLPFLKVLNQRLHMWQGIVHDLWTYRPVLKAEFAKIIQYCIRNFLKMLCFPVKIRLAMKFHWKCYHWYKTRMLLIINY